MQLKALRVFCDVAEAGSFSRGAATNGISQSAASQLVQQLEDELSVKLIDRSKRPWVLTLEGECYFRGCRKLVRQYKDLEAQVRSFHDEVAGSVKVAAIYSVGLSHMNLHVQDFLRRYPKAVVQLKYEHPDRVYDLVERDAVDVGLVSYPKSNRHVAAEPWRDEAFVFACAPRHALARRKLLSLADLEGVDLICFESSLKIRRKLDRELAAHGIAFHPVMEFDNTEVIKRAIETGAGGGLMPEPTVAREVQLGTLVAIPILNESGQPAMKRPMGVIHRRGRQLSSTATRFIRELQQREPAGDELQISSAISANSTASSRSHHPAEDVSASAALEPSR